MVAMIILVGLLVACTPRTDSTEPPETTGSLEDMYLDELTLLLSEDIPGVTVYLAETKENLLSANIVIKDGEIAYLGNYIMATKSAFEEVIPAELRGRFDVGFWIDANADSVSILFASDNYTSNESADITGLLMDTRSGEPVTTRIESKADLIEKFPALALEAE